MLAQLVALKVNRTLSCARALYCVSSSRGKLEEQGADVTDTVGAGEVNGSGWCNGRFKLKWLGLFLSREDMCLTIL